jgi:integrase
MATKTARHFAPPVPAAWVERFRLREDFEGMRAEVNRRWRIHWTEVSGVRVATNNASISNMLYTQFSLRGLTKLWAAATGGEEKDWARPYDFRHAYAIRCATSDETAHCLDDQMARWMGHGVEVHRRIYLRWLSASREKASLQGRFAGETEQVAEQVTAQAAPLPPEIQARLEKLEKLEKLLAG